MECAICKGNADYKATEQPFMKLAPFLCAECVKGLERRYEKIGMHKQEAVAEVEV